MRFKDFKTKYQDIVPIVSFKVMRAAVREIFTSLNKREDELDPKFAPAVVMILGREGSRNFTCFVDDLERLLASSLNERPAARVQAEGISSSQLTDGFTSALVDNGNHFIILDGVNKLDDTSFMHLHMYTDHETAVHRKAVILLLGYTDDVDYLDRNSPIRAMDSLASEFLFNSFIKRLHQDQIEPMIARLTPSVTAVLNLPGGGSIC